MLAELELVFVLLLHCLFTIFTVRIDWPCLALRFICRLVFNMNYVNMFEVNGIRGWLSLYSSKYDNVISYSLVLILI